MITLVLLALVGFSKAAQPLAVRANISEARFEGSIERESVRRSLSAKINDFKLCGIATGNLELQMIVDENAQLTFLKATLLPHSNVATEQCFEKVAKTLFLPAAEKENTATISVGFEIRENTMADSRNAEKREPTKPDTQTQPPSLENTPKFKMQSACEAYRDLEKVNNESKAKDLQLRKLAYDNNARSKVFRFYATQMSGLKNKADAFSEEYQKQTGKVFDRNKDCGF